MAEPTGIFIDFEIEEHDLKKVLKHAFTQAKHKKKVGYYLSELLYDRIYNPENVFILNYDKKSKNCFIAWQLNHYQEKLFLPFEELLNIMAPFISNKATANAVVATSYPEVLFCYKVTANKFKKLSADSTTQDIADRLVKKLWNFAENNDFPEPQKALKKRNYFYKNFKNYYYKYTEIIHEVEKPKKIAEATKENPYNLFGNFFTFDNIVVLKNDYTSQIIEIPKACPMTLREVSGILADKNFVFLKGLAKNSPPKEVKDKYGRTINNPNARWEYTIAEGVDGESFNFVKEKWDTIYWSDKSNIFIVEGDNLKKVNLADRDSFKYLDFCFGKDNNHIFYYNNVLPIAPNNYTLTKEGFLFDTNNIYYKNEKITLDASTFEVLGIVPKKRIKLQVTYLLKDINGCYEFNYLFKGNKLKPHK